MKNKRKVISILALLLLTIIIIILSRPNTGYPINRLIIKVFDINRVKVNVNDSININDITINCLNAEGESKIIFKNGVKCGKIKNEHGGDNFEVYFKDSLIARCGIFKTNWWYTHTFFTFLLINQEIA